MNHTIANGPRSSIIGGAGARVGTRPSEGANRVNWGAIVSSKGAVVDSCNLVLGGVKSEILIRQKKKKIRIRII